MLLTNLQSVQFAFNFLYLPYYFNVLIERKSVLSMCHTYLQTNAKQHIYVSVWGMQTTIHLALCSHIKNVTAYAAHSLERKKNKPCN